MAKYKYYDDRLLIELPDEFIDMAEDSLKVMFSYKIKPNVAKENGRGCIFTMDYVEQRLEENEVFHAVYAMQRKINKLIPQSIVYNTQMIKNNNVKAAWFAFKTYSLKGELIHTMFASPVDSNFLMGSFHWDMEKKKEVVDLTKGFLGTVKIFQKPESNKGHIYEKNARIY